MHMSPYSDYKIVNIQQNFPKLCANVYVFKRCRLEALCEASLYLYISY